ncbi:hypothetical protein NDU88_003678 [Pleurodeles waltl]|uniref:Uncharacterized protein n=1 Tax=Pleurodeles waltl TaxID=8319 RepID=A0AAV7PDI8_PLEWA|nr:hypothetical protein NDU88_003678 [Pleurodeles waltl]
MQRGILACERMGQNLEKKKRRGGDDGGYAVSPSWFLTRNKRLFELTVPAPVCFTGDEGALPTGRRDIVILSSGDAAGCHAERCIDAGCRRSSGKQRLPARPWEAATSFGRLLMVIEFGMKLVSATARIVVAVWVA